MATFIKAGFWDKLCQPCKGYKGWLNLDELIQSFIPKPTYKVYTALLTQSGGDDPITITSDNDLYKGITYEITDNPSNTDLTPFGAPNSIVGTKFVSNQTVSLVEIFPPDLFELSYNTGAPVVTVLENTIGNIWFIYMATGYYTIKNSNGQFKSNIFYTTQISSVDPILYSLNTFSVSGWDDFTLNIIGSGDGLLFKAPIEIRVYS